MLVEATTVPLVTVATKESDYVWINSGGTLQTSKLMFPAFPKGGDWKPLKKNAVTALECAMQWRSGNLVIHMINAVFDVESTMAIVAKDPAWFTNDPAEKASIEQMSMPLANMLKEIEGILKNIKLDIECFEDATQNVSDRSKCRSLGWVEVMKFFLACHALDAVQQRNINWNCLEQVQWLGDEKMTDFLELWWKCASNSPKNSTYTSKQRGSPGCGSRSTRPTTSTSNNFFAPMKWIR